nr:hypothetical protein [Tanacetum cinerariifolium]
MYDNSSPRPPEELNAKIADTIVESIPSLPIPVQDGNSQREEIDIVTETNDVLPPSVEDEDDLSNDPFLEEADLFFPIIRYHRILKMLLITQKEMSVFWKNYLSMISFF